MDNDIDIEYENVCLNCKEKGYYFGYSFKTIKYHDIIVLDIPTRHLNGPAMAFYYHNWPLLIHSTEISHPSGSASDKPVFLMINTKKGQHLQKFTYQYKMQNNKALWQPPEKLLVEDPVFDVFVDTYQYPNKPYLMMFYGFLNKTGEPLTNFNFYQFYDFDIYGREGYNHNLVKYDAILDAIFQYDTEIGGENSLMAGITSTSSNLCSHFEGNHPNEILMTTQRLDLRDIGEFGPDDCAVALQWKIGQLEPDELKIFPVIMGFGFGEAEFLENCKQGKEHAEELMDKVDRSFKEAGRLNVDPKLEQLSFSVTEWCKDN
jgi:hypothetical protein